jgi:hypothetical protein
MNKVNDSLMNLARAGFPVWRGDAAPSVQAGGLTRVSFGARGLLLAGFSLTDTYLSGGISMTAITSQAIVIEDFIVAILAGRFTPPKAGHTLPPACRTLYRDD